MQPSTDTLRVVSRTPYRISFFGGGTDYPAWYREHGGSVLATSIKNYCYVSVRNMPPWSDVKYRIVYSKIEDRQQVEDICHPAVNGVLMYLRDWLQALGDGGYEVCHEGDLPARTGLGSSSTFTVGFLHAMLAHLQTAQISKQMLAMNAIKIEQEVIKENVGSQDQVSAAYGGFNRCDFLQSGAIRVTPTRATRETLALLESRLVLVFTGIARYAQDVARATVQALPKKQKHMATMYGMVEEAEAMLMKDDLDEFGRLLGHSWFLKRSLTDGITNAHIDALYAAGLNCGALGGKLLGAGAGGFMLFYARNPENFIPRFLAQCPKALVVPVRFETRGSHLVKHVPINE